MSATPKPRRTAPTPKCTSRTPKERSEPPEKTGTDHLFREKRGLSLISFGYPYPRAVRSVARAGDRSQGCATAFNSAARRRRLLRLRCAGSGLRLRLRRTGAVSAQSPRHHAFARALAAMGVSRRLAAGENPQGTAWLEGALRDQRDRHRCAYRRRRHHEL